MTSSEEFLPPVEDGPAADELYNTMDIARIFRVSTKTVTRWAEKGEFERRGVHVRHTIGGHRRFDKEEIHKLFQLMLDGKLYEDDSDNPRKAASPSRIDRIPVADPGGAQPE